MSQPSKLFGDVPQELPEELRQELDAIAGTLRPPLVSLERLIVVAERERRRRHGLVMAALATVVVLAVATMPVALAIRSGPSSTPPAQRPTTSPSAQAAPDLTADLDDDGLDDAVAISGRQVTVTLATGASLVWEADRRAPELLGAVDLGRGRPGLVLAGWTESGRDSAIVLLVRDGALVRADPTASVNRDQTQTMWVEDGVFRHAVCLCVDGPQDVDVWRVELAADGHTLKSVPESRRCWDPASDRDPASTC